MKKMKILITGGCGFVGHHFVEHIIKNTDWEIIILDKLSYASNGFDRLRDIKVYDDKRVYCLAANFSEKLEEGIVKEIGQVDYIVHMGAETHVNNSIENPEPFIFSNILGTHYMLEFAKAQKNLKWFVMFSTDEVYGPATKGIEWKEIDRYNATNPYSATKAGAEQLVNAYANTYKIPAFIINTMNIFGERQHFEKFIPMVVKKVLMGEEVVIHSDSAKIIPGSRFWIHARNVAAAVLFLLDKAKFRERYNIVGEKEVNNLEMAQFIAGVLGISLKYKMVDFHSSRPGHDLRYALDGMKMRKMGWKIPTDFESTLKKTVKWIISSENKKWL